MEIKNQVVSLELSKKLKELGVKQESLWYWYIPCIDTTDKDLVLNSKGRVLSRDGEFAEVHERVVGFEIKEKFSAFTVAELFQLLPEKVCWRITLREKYILSFGEHNEEDENLANTLVKMLIYLLENNLIK